MELQIAHVRQQLSLSLFPDFENMSVFKPVAHHSDAADTMCDQLETWSPSHEIRPRTGDV